MIATARSTPTVALFAAGTGLNCFAFGATFSTVRAGMFRALHDPKARGPQQNFSPREKVYISGASGAVTGLALGLLLSGLPARPSAARRHLNAQ